MGDKTGALGGGLNITPAQPPAAKADAEDAAMTARALDAAVLGPQVGDLFVATPGFRLKLGASAMSNDSVRNYLNLAQGQTPQSFLNSQVLNGNPQGKVNANFSLSYTPPGLDISKSFVPTITVAADGDIAPSTRGIGATTATAANILKQGDAIAGQAATMQSQIAGSIAQMQSLMQQLQTAAASKNYAALQTLEPKALAALTNIQNIIAKAQGTLDSASALSDSLSKQSLALGAGVSARGTVSTDLTLRRQIAEAKGPNGSIRLTGAATVGFLAPIPIGEQQTLGGMEAIHTSMVALNAVVRVQGQGFQDLSKTISDLSKMLGSLNSQITGIKSNPNALIDPRVADATAKNAETLATNAQTLAGTLSKELGDLSGNAQVGMRVTQASSAGVELKDLGLKLDGDIGKKFYYDVAITFRHLLGAMQGTSNTYTIANDNSFAAQVLEKKTLNVYPIFFPATGGVDAGISFRPKDGISVSLRGGGEARLDGSNTTAYAGLITNLYHVHFGVGIVIPEVSRTDVLKPMPAASLGVGGKHFDVSLAASVSAPSTTSILDLSGGQATLQFTIK